MRTVSFSESRVQDVLNNQLVCTYSDTTGDPTAGGSLKHAPGEAPGPCGRGAGRQNVQLLFMTPDREVFHVATGFLDAGDLLSEIQFARHVHDGLKRQKSQRRQWVASSHADRLRKLGFQSGEITAADNMFTDMMLSGPNPQDFGIRMPAFQNRAGTTPAVAGNMFRDVGRQRILKDNQYSVRYPLITREQFEQQPELLVGRHKSFFGSHSAMNGVGQMVNQHTHRALGGR